jgi:hypothetical protein
MKPRHALHVSDGNTDSIIHAESSECGMSSFDIGTIDFGVSVAAAWNRRAPAVPPNWINVNDRLPDVVYHVDGCVNSVLAMWKPERLAGNLCNPSTSNTVYLRNNVDQFSHWMPLPPPPEAASQPDSVNPTVKE